MSNDASDNCVLIRYRPQSDYISKIEFTNCDISYNDIIQLNN